MIEPKYQNPNMQNRIDMIEDRKRIETSIKAFQKFFDHTEFHNNTISNKKFWFFLELGIENPWI